EGKIVRVVTDAEGNASIPGASTGSYKIAVSLEGFEQSVQTVVIQDDRQDVDVEFTLLSKLRRTDSVDVVADAETLQTQAATPAAAELKTADTEALPSRPSTVAD